MGLDDTLASREEINKRLTHKISHTVREEWVGVGKYTSDEQAQSCGTI